MSTTVDPSVETPVTSLPPPILGLGKKHIQDFMAAAGAHGQDWSQATLAPVARYLHDPGDQTNAGPAYAEFRVLNGGNPNDGRGYILVSLTESDFPVPEFATSGDTKTDHVLREAPGGIIHKFMRFGPAYIVAEDAVGEKLSAIGSAPLKASGSIPQTSLAVAGGNSGMAPPPKETLNWAPAASYQDLKLDCRTNPLRIHGRSLRAREAAAAWRLKNGVRNPTLSLKVGETRDFLPGKSLTIANVVTVDAVELARVEVLPKGGLRVTGVAVGGVMVKTQTQDGLIDYYTFAVAAGPTAITTRDFVNEQFWLAGTDWDGDQRKYGQLEWLKKWCPAVGCGPTALAMLLGWWDVNSVPSAFYRLEGGAGDPHNFRFNFESLHDSDAPKESADNTADSANLTATETSIVPVYNDLYYLTNTKCWGAFSDQGSTYPTDMVGGFNDYLSRIRDHQPSPMNEYGESFVACNWHYSFVTPGLGLTDWNGGGKLVARGIKSGYPGVVGIGSWLGDLHYPLAYGFETLAVQVDGAPAELSQYFKCNMGWGRWHAPEYHRAEDVWFGLTAHLWQTAMPTLPQTVLPTTADDIIASAFAATAAFGSTVNCVSVFSRDANLGFQYLTSNDATNSSWPTSWQNGPVGQFRSGPAACMSADARNLHVFGRGNDDRIWRAHSPDGGGNWTAGPDTGGGQWDVGWDAIGDGVFNSGPAACLSADGQNLHVFGRGNDNKIWRAHSPDGGSSWDVAWSAIGTGTFTSGPSACISANGQSLHVFGRGGDNGMWRAHSPDGGTSWDVAWSPIETGTFTSGPAACVSADGQSLHLFGRGGDNRIWRAHSLDGGGTWDVAWSAVGDGTFITAPAAAISADGLVIQLFGVGTDHRVWRALSLDGGASWPIAWSPLNGATVF